MIEHLPYLVPFKPEEWSSATIADIVESERFKDFYLKCVGEISKSKRIRLYANIFTMITHLGRLPDFDRKSYGKFLKEAGSQKLTPNKLRESLEIVLLTSGPNEAIPTAATAFEFVHFSSDFGRYMAQQLGVEDDLHDLLIQLSTFAIMAFIVAVNVDLGNTSPSAWQLQNGPNRP